MIQAYLALTILEETLDVPPGERYVQQRFQRNIWSGIREKVLALAGQDWPDRLGGARDALLSQRRRCTGQRVPLEEIPDS